MNTSNDVSEYAQYGLTLTPMHEHALAQVDVGMALIHIGLDEQSSILEVDAWMRLAWTDEYLAWNKSDYEGKNAHACFQSFLQ